MSFFGALYLECDQGTIGGVIVASGYVMYFLFTSNLFTISCISYDCMESIYFNSLFDISSQFSDAYSV